VRALAVVLGDQLDRNSAVFDGFDPKRDAIWMAEVTAESTHVRSHRARIAVFLIAMRRFRDELRARGYTVHYRELSEGTLAGFLDIDRRRLKPERVVCVEPGDWRVRDSLRPLVDRFLEDRHFLATAEDFRRHAEGRKSLRMEYFYREMRRRHAVLMDDGRPVGGDWNYDAENRESFPSAGPSAPPRPAVKLTKTHREVFALVEQRFADHPGSLDNFRWPTVPAEAEASLEHFLADCLPNFGRYQDAMWAGEPFLYHSLISSSLNLKLLDPRDAIRRAESAYREGRAPLAAAEGFIRQILGWREYVRGIYWRNMPDYAGSNALNAHEPLPAFYWTGDTDMACLRECVSQTLDHGYAHHIQRLMVTGLFALLYGVAPKEIHEWYLAVYVDAVEWVELPNTIGMSQFADGGVMASKPYAATGKYIQRMSNYCKNCRYDPAESAGADACPFTALYWDFLMRNETTLRRVPRMEMQLRNLTRLTPAKRQAIRERASDLRSRLRGSA
jgi:deoxyribodipyrimidine photolyase-related protein